MSVKRNYSAIAEDVVKAQRGDRAAMDRIIADVQDPVYYTCLSILRSEDAAQDAAQDVLLSVFTKIGSLKDAGAYIGWVNRITANTCKLRLMKPNREVFLAEDKDGKDPFAAFEDVDEQTIPDKALDNAETQRMVVELVNNLPDEQRMCVMLYYYDDMKTREIADALDVPEGTVKSRLNYARKSLKEGVERLEKQGDIRLHGLSPIPFLAYWLKKAAEENASPVTAQIIRTAAGAAGAGAAGTAAAAATGGAAAIVGRILTGVLSICLLIGIGYGIWHSFDRNPPVIPDEERMETATPAPSEAQEPTAAPGTADADRTPAPEIVHLYGETYYYGARFRVDQDYDGGAVRLNYENDETVFALTGVQLELETDAGTYQAQASFSGIGAGESGVLEQTWENASGTPIALTVRGVVPQSPGAPTDETFRIVFTDAREDEPVESERITGQVMYRGMRFTVDQTYTDSGMGKIVLRIRNDANRISFGGDGVSTVRLETARGSFETAVKRTFEPNAEETLTLYFNNASGMPNRLTVGEVYLLGTDGQPAGEAVSVAIPLTAGTRPAAQPTPEPTLTPEPVWSEWSMDEPPEDAQQIETRMLYCRKGIYYNSYYFDEAYGTKEAAEAAVDAAIAADLSALEAQGCTVYSGPSLSMADDNWINWFKSIRVAGPYTDWTLWNGNPDELRSTDGLTGTLSAAEGRTFVLSGADFQQRAEYRYAMY